MGGKAVEILCEGESDRMMAYVNQGVVSLPLEVAYGERKPFNFTLYELANQLAI